MELSLNRISMLNRISIISLFIVLNTSCFAQVSPPTDPIPAAGEVNIFRDTFGVPHVYAANEFDGFFGVGYALAEDNLESILRRYIGVSGKLAEVFGPDFVQNDLFVEQFNILADAQTAFLSIDQGIKGAYSAFINGVIQFMTDNPTKVPLWWASQIPLEPELITAFLHFVNVGASSVQAYQNCSSGGVTVGVPAIDQFVNSPSEEKLDTISRIASNGQEHGRLPMARTSMSGSNVMVLMNSKTFDNVVYFDTDSHVSFSSQKDEIRLHAGSLHVMGVVPAGAALPVFGHNENVAWGISNGGADVGDCYKFDIDPLDASRYLFDGLSKPFITQNVIINVLNEPARVFNLEYVEKNGLQIPVIAKRGNQEYTEEYTQAYAASVAFQGKAGLFDRSLALMNQAQNVAGIQSALDNNGFTPQNIMAADTNGDTYYIRAGLVPQRSPEFNWGEIVNGGTSDSDWLLVNGSLFHPRTDLVQVQSPDSGYMHNNNVAPDKMMADADVPEELKSDNYPAYIYNGGGNSHARGIRAIELLQPWIANATDSDFIEIVYDEKWISAFKWSLALSAAIANTPSWTSKPQEVQDFGNRIVNFDGFADKSSTAALNYVFWLDSINNIAQNPQTIVTKVMAEQSLTSGEHSDLIAAVESSVTRMNSPPYNSPTLTYGEVFRIGRGGVLFGLGGGDARVGNIWSEQTIRAFGFDESPTEPGRGDAKSGQLHPMAMRLNINGKIESASVRPYGQSNNPNSQHYSDQSQLMGDETMKSTFFEYSDLRNNLESFITITTN